MGLRIGTHIMTLHALKDNELIDYADHHSGTMATSPGRINPYKLGIELFRDIERPLESGRIWARRMRNVRIYKRVPNGIGKRARPAKYFSKCAGSIMTSVLSTNF